MAHGKILFAMQIEVEASKANDAVLFYKTALDAKEVHRNWKTPSEDFNPLTIVAEFEIDGSRFSFVVAHRRTHRIVEMWEKEMFGEIVTEDVEGRIAKMVTAGAVEDGQETDRCGRKVWRVKDPYGYVWKFRTKEEHSPLGTAAGGTFVEH